MIGAIPSVLGAVRGISWFWIILTMLVGMAIAILGVAYLLARFQQGRTKEAGGKIIMPERYREDDREPTSRIRAAFVIGITALVMLAVIFLIRRAVSLPQDDEANFKLDIKSAIFSVPEIGTNRTDILLEVCVNNSGLPSIGTKWRLEVRLQNNSKLNGFGAVIPKNLALDGKPFGDHPELDTITGSTKIGDTNVVGWLQFFVDARQSDVKNDDTQLTVSVEDLKGNRFFNTITNRNLFRL